MTFVIIAIIAGILFWGIFKLTVGSIEGLGYRVNTFYPFNLIVKRPTMWSTFFYLFIIIALTAFVLLLAQGRNADIMLPGLPA